MVLQERDYTKFLTNEEKEAFEKSAEAVRKTNAILKEINVL